MTSILLIEPNGSIKQTKVKDVTQENLYKKCGFKTNNEFSKKYTWTKTINNEKVIIQLWAKETGKANNENKYDFPPPMDTTLFFGTCVLVRVVDDNNIIDLEKSLWTKVYEKLFGGFHDLGNDEDDEISEDELLNVDKHKKTKHGYLKDGFVVDSVTNSDDTADEADDDADDADDADDDADDADDNADDNEVNTKNKMNKQEDETIYDNGDDDSEDDGEDEVDDVEDDTDEEDENMFNSSSDINDDFDGSELEESDYEYSDENDD